MARRGFTLLETLIALGLVVAIGALAIPAVWGRAEGARLDGASRQVCAMIVRCREEAQRRGEPLALSYSDAGGEWLVMERVGGAERAAGETEPTRGIAGDPATASSTETRGALVEIDREPLPAGIVVTLDREPAGAPGADGASGASAAVAPGKSAAAASQGRLRLVVFMPDGSAVATGAAAFYVRASAESVHPLEVVAHRWSGGAEVRQLDLSKEMEDGGTQETEAPPPPASSGTKEGTPS